MRSNIHCHTTYSDGADTMEAMVQAAIEKGFVSLGFSEHAWAPYDPDCCIKQEDIPAYLLEAVRLKKKYAGAIELYTGFEVDRYETLSKEGLDFTIGSVHYVFDRARNAYYTIDYLPEQFEKARDLVAGGDIRALVRIYYEQVLWMAESYRPDVIAHVDLVTKLNRGGAYFDEDSDWYRAQVATTAERLAAAGCIVEVNTGGISRGYKTEPYPSVYFLQQLHAGGVPVMINSDAHAAETLDFWFDQAEELLRAVGYRTVMQLRGGAFVETPL